MTFFARGLLTSGFAFVILAGCGEKGPATVPVKGKVTLDGTPIENGNIIFEPKDGVGGPAGAEIKGGEYSVNVQPGPKRIRITAQKVVGKKQVYPGSADSPEVDVTEEIVPAKYNTETTLEQDLSKGADNVDFKLESK